jgi:hypothetical protein
MKSLTSIALRVFAAPQSAALYPRQCRLKTPRKATLPMASASTWPTAVSPATAAPGRAATTMVRRRSWPKRKRRSRVSRVSCAIQQTTCRLIPMRYCRTRTLPTSMPMSSRYRARGRQRIFRSSTIKGVRWRRQFLTSQPKFSNAHILRPTVLSSCTPTLDLQPEQLQAHISGKRSTNEDALMVAYARAQGWLPPEAPW